MTRLWSYSDGTDGLITDRTYICSKFLINLDQLQVLYQNLIDQTAQHPPDLDWVLVGESEKDSYAQREDRFLSPQILTSF